MNKTEFYRSKIDGATGFNDIWKIVKETVKNFLGEYRNSMLLFLDDLPLRLGAYHPLGTNNIVLNRKLVNIVKATIRTKKLVNAFVYSLLLHEYLHALGHISESEVQSLAYKVSVGCFGEDHEVTKLTEETPWSLLRGVQLNRTDLPKAGMKIVKDFEETNRTYIT